MELLQYPNLFSWHVPIFVVFCTWFLYSIFYIILHINSLSNTCTTPFYTPYSLHPSFHLLLSCSSSSFNLQSFSPPTFIFIFFVLTWKLIHSFLGWKVTFVDALIFFGWNLFFLQPFLILFGWNLQPYVCCWFDLLCILFFWTCKVSYIFLV